MKESILTILNFCMTKDTIKKSYTRYRAYWQGGGVEGRALTPSCENTGITANC